MITLIFNEFPQGPDWKFYHITSEQWGCQGVEMAGVYDKNMGRFDRSFYLAYNLNA